MRTEFVNVGSFSTRLGVVRTAATVKGLVLISLPGGSARKFDVDLRNLLGTVELRPAGPANRKALRQIRGYLDGQLEKFALPLDIRGTVFEKRVLARVKAIPFGRTMTYGSVAEAVGHPGAARAVGGVMARNRLPLVVPCHRVVATTGLGGFAGGLGMKEKLLRLEGAL